MRFLLFVGLSPVSIGFLPFGIYRIYAEKLALKMRKNLDFIEVFCLGIFFSALLWEALTKKIPAHKIKK